MKLIHKIIYIILAVGMCGTLAGQPAATVPTEIRYTPIVNCSEELLPVLSVISNAVLSVDRILKSTNYTRVVQFGRTVWLESEDKAQLTVWRIAPYGTTTVVGGIQALVYQDAGMTQKDPTRSFQMNFYPETGMLRNFWWDDSHEVLFAYTNGPFSVDYARRLDGKKSLDMRWDANGNLVSSNVYNWATRGQPIIKPENILPAQVTLKPEALEVSPGILTAFVKLPDGYPVSGITSATCDGAPCEKMMLSTAGGSASGGNDDGSEMIMKFRRTDIEAALAQIGESLDIHFVVRGSWQDEAGNFYLFQGTDSITKIVGAKKK